MRARPRMRAYLPGAPMPAYRCLQCGHEFDRAGGIGVEPPRYPSAGSLSLCIRCGAVGIFRADLQLRPPTAQEMRDIDSDPDVRKIRDLLARAIKERSS